MKWLALLLLLGRASALEPWTWGDTAGEGALGALFLVDWGQTNSAMRAGGMETNSLLPSHPSEERLAVHFGAFLVAHATIARLLPSPFRRIWQVLYMGIEIQAIHHNATWIGLRLTY